MFGVTIHKRTGIDVRVTTFERMTSDLDAVIAYIKLLDNATTASKTGYFLEQHKAALLVDDRYLEELKKIKPKQPHYMVRGGRETYRLCSPQEHAGGKGVLNYQSYTGQSGNIEVDLNFMFRLPLWNVTKLQSNIVGNRQLSQRGLKRVIYSTGITF